MDFAQTKALYGDAVPPKEHRLPGVFPVGGTSPKWFYFARDPERKKLGKDPKIKRIVGSYWATAEAFLAYKGIEVVEGPQTATIMTDTRALVRASVTPEHRQVAFGRGNSTASIAAMLGMWEKETNTRYDQIKARELARELTKGFVGDITRAWAFQWIGEMKVRKLKPATIRTKVQCLARALDWYYTKQAMAKAAALGGGKAAEDEAMDKRPRNPLKELGDRYAEYKKGEYVGTKPEDMSRDRRLFPGEYDRIQAVIRGEHQRDLKRFQLRYGEESEEARKALSVIFFLLTNTAMRLSEVYQLQVYQVERNGVRSQFMLPAAKVKKRYMRTVPMSPEVLKVMTEWMSRDGAPKGAKDAVFPIYHDPAVYENPKALETERAGMSALAGRVIDFAGITDMTTHDLRHEGICRWVERKDKKGLWLYKAEEIMKYVGHKDWETFQRYLSKRGSDDAARMYEGEEGYEEAANEPKYDVAEEAAGLLRHLRKAA
jgi:integrase